MKKSDLQRLVRVVLKEIREGNDMASMDVGLNASPSGRIWEDGDHADDGYLDSKHLSDLSKLFNKIVLTNDEIRKARRKGRNEDALIDYKDSIELGLDEIVLIIQKLKLK